MSESTHIGLDVHARSVWAGYGLGGAPSLPGQRLDRSLPVARLPPRHSVSLSARPCRHVTGSLVGKTSAVLPIRQEMGAQ